MNENKNFKDKTEDVLKKGMDIAEDGLEKVKETVVKTLDVDKDGDVDFDDFKLIASKITKKGKEIIKGQEENK